MVHHCMLGATIPTVGSNVGLILHCCRLLFVVCWFSKCCQSLIAYHFLEIFILAINKGFHHGGSNHSIVERNNTPTVSSFRFKISRGREANDVTVSRVESVVYFSFTIGGRGGGVPLSFLSLIVLVGFGVYVGIHIFST